MTKYISEIILFLIILFTIYKFNLFLTRMKTKIKRFSLLNFLLDFHIHLFSFISIHLTTNTSDISVYTISRSIFRQIWFWVQYPPVTHHLIINKQIWYSFYPAFSLSKVNTIYDENIAWNLPKKNIKYLLKSILNACFTKINMYVGNFR